MDAAPTGFLKTNAVLAQVFGHTLSHLIESIRQVMMVLFKSIVMGLQKPLERINTQQHAGALTLELQEGIAEYKATYARAIVKVVDRIEAYVTRNVFKVDDELLDGGFLRLAPYAQVDFTAPPVDDEIAVAERALADEIAKIQAAKARNAAIDRTIAAAERLAAAMPTQVPEVSDLEPLVQKLRAHMQNLQTAPAPDSGVDKEYLQTVLYS